MRSQLDSALAPIIAQSLQDSLQAQTLITSQSNLNTRLCQVEKCLNLAQKPKTKFDEIESDFK